jgi:hypothetical protein
MRAGRLVAAIGELCADLHGRGLWDASDAELLEAVWQSTVISMPPQSRRDSKMLDQTPRRTGTSQPRHEVWSEQWNGLSCANRARKR